MLALAKRSNKIKRSLGDRTFSIFNHLFLGFCAAVCIFPLFYVFMYSITPYEDYLADPLRLFPPEVTFTAYKELFTFPLMKTGYFSTIFVTVVGTALNIFLLCITAYPLSKRNLKGRNVIMALITFTMFFNGGMIPNYMLIRNLKLLDTYWALILPGAISAYNLILMRNFVAAIPPSLEEAAYIDGANELQILWKVIVPLCKPALVSVGLFNFIWTWNAFMDPLIYISSVKKYPLSLALRMTLDLGSAAAWNEIFAMSVLSILPPVLLFFAGQKYFIQGISTSGLKG